MHISSCMIVIHSLARPGHALFGPFGFMNFNWPGSCHFVVEFRPLFLIGWHNLRYDLFLLIRILVFHSRLCPSWPWVANGTTGPLTDFAPCMLSHSRRSCIDCSLSISVYSSSVTDSRWDNSIRIRLKGYQTVVSSQSLSRKRTKIAILASWSGQAILERPTI